jgi:hypothetical protein
MLALWSRAVRTQGTCRCISCISNSSAVSSQGGAVTLRGAWALGTPTSTFVYTGVFAAGLAYDAKSKRKRNEQWEAAFTHLREGLDQTSTQEHSRIVEVEANEVTVDDDDFPPTQNPLEEGLNWAKVYRVAGTELEDNVVAGLRDGVVSSEQPYNMDLEHLSESLWQLLPYDSRFPSAPTMEWLANTGPNPTRFHLPPQSLWAPENVRWTAMRTRQVWKKLTMQELSVGALIYSLLGHTNVPQLPDDVLASLSPHIRQVIQMDKQQRLRCQSEVLDGMERLANVDVKISKDVALALAKLHTVDIAIPKYFQDSDGDFHFICSQMNSALKNIIDEKPYDEHALAVATAKICHNLLVSSAAPDVQTINLLVSGFGRWKQPKLVDAVITAFTSCKIRPNEITCAAVLNHYIQNNRPDCFSLFVARMRGVRNALMLARRDVTINEAAQGRLIRVKEDKVYQKVYPTPMVFNTLMLGVLRFAGFDRAMEVYMDMKEDRWGMDVFGLGHFLEDCIQRANWEGGLFIWEEIDSIKTGVKKEHMSKAYAQMLSLCSVTSKTVAFNHILNEVVRRGFDPKRILSSAAGTTKQADKTKWAPRAPAWTADNVLIAVSHYMSEEDTSNQTDIPTAVEDDDDGTETPNEAVDLTYDRPLPGDKTSNTRRVPIKDPDEAWAMWMQNELGETPHQVLKKKGSPEKPKTSSRKPKTGLEELIVSSEKLETSYKRESSPEKPKTGLEELIATSKGSETSSKKKSSPKNPNVDLEELIASSKKLETSHRKESSPEKLKASPEKPRTGLEELIASSEKLEPSPKKPKASSKKPKTSPEAPETGPEKPKTSTEEPKTSRKKRNASKGEIEAKGDAFDGFTYDP